MKSLAPKTILQNRYQITDLIGKGGMGEVYLAIDQRLGHSVALKRTTVNDDVMLAEAFEREAKTLAQLRHSNLPKVSDHFSENEEQFLVMEYISGEDLSERLISTKKAFPLNWVMFWADQLLEALTYLHTFNPPIIHRDIKPQNLKLTKDNQIVLLDFGLSKNTAGDTQVTSSGSVVGYTPHYASMEQIRGTGTNACSDLFSLSATLYHLLSNNVPVDALTRADAMLSGLPDPLKSLTEINPEITEKISNAILKGMDLSQDRRFESAREMQKAFRRAFNEMQESVSAETVAFNLDESGGANEEASIADANTEVISGLAVPSEVVSESTFVDKGVESAEVGEEIFPPISMVGLGEADFSGEETEVINKADLHEAIEAENLNDNIQNQEPLVDNSSNEVPGAITEVIPQHVLKKSLAEANEDIPSELPVDTEFGTNEVDSSEDVAQSFESEEDSLENKDKFEASAAGADLEDAASIDVSQDNIETGGDSKNWDDGFESKVLPAEAVGENLDHGTVTNFNEPDEYTGENAENFLDEDAADSYSQGESNAEEFDAAAAAEDSVAKKDTIPPSKQKGSNSKYLAALGGLGVVMLLLLGSVALGWYYLNGENNVGNTNAVVDGPTPEIKEEETPEVTTNPEVVEAENTNLEDSTNTKSDDDNTNISQDGNDSEIANTESPGSTESKSSKSKATTTAKSTTKTTTTKPEKKIKTPPIKQPSQSKNSKSTSKKKKKKKSNSGKQKKPKAKVKDAGVL